MTVVFNGVELDDRHQLRHCGLLTARDMRGWAGERIYPNEWFLMGAARKPFSLVSPHPALRYMGGFMPSAHTPACPGRLREQLFRCHNF